MTYENNKKKHYLVQGDSQSIPPSGTREVVREKAVSRPCVIIIISRLVKHVFSFKVNAQFQVCNV